LLDHGANVNAITSNGETPLHLALSDDMIEIVQLLLDNGANINAKLNIRLAEGDTPFFRTIGCGDLKCFRLLLEYGRHCVQFNVNEKDDDGRTPLHLTAFNKQYEFMKLLLENGADVNAKDETGSTPLHTVVGYYDDILHRFVHCTDIKCLELLLNHGADIHVKNNAGETAFNLASDEYKQFMEYYDDIKQPGCQ
jgi:ankyrin repeat protein